MAIDAGDEAKLRSLLLVSTSSAEHIIDVCRTAESLLQSLHSPAQARNFFATFLPPLLQKIFGFQQQENVGSSPLTSSTSKPVSQVEPASSSFSQGWLSVISSSHDAAAAAKSLVSLLSPEGLLLTSLLRLDKQSSSLRFLFPTERLPDWVQYALIKCAPSSLHSPSRIQFSRISKLFMDRIKPIPGGPSQVQLDTFEYFFFWFAFYAVCKHDRGGGDSSKEQQCKEASDSKVQKKSFPNWVSGLHNHRHSLTNWSIIHHASHQKNTNVPPLDPYLQLLQLYLTHYVPVSSSIRDYPSFARSEYDKASLGAGACLPYRTEFLLQTLTEFWLPNTDFSNAEDFVPPNLQLTNALRMLVNHINTLNPAFSGGGTSFTWSHIMQKPLYVFIRRAFKTWTSVTPVEKASRVVDVWLDFLQPWALNETMTTNSEVTASGEKFTENWHNFVSHNYLFYTNLTIYFLEFALKHVQRNVEAVLQMTSKILNVLAGSTKLLDYLKHLTSLLCNNDAALIKKSNVLIATIFDQLQELEDNGGNLREGFSDVMSSGEVRLFGKDGNGGEAMLELLILQAEGELQLVPHGKYTSCKKALEAIEKAGGMLFSKKIAPPVSPIATSVAEMDNGLVTAKVCTVLPQHTWQDVKYKGDWMRRPIESTEFGWLVRILVRVTDAINEKLELSEGCEMPDLEDDDGEDGNQDPGQGRNVVTIRPQPDMSMDVTLPKLLALISWCVSSAITLLAKIFRDRGWRLNLRFLAKKPIALTVAALMIYFWQRLFMTIFFMLF